MAKKPAATTLAANGWDSAWEMEFAHHAAKGMHPARVMADFGVGYDVLTAEGYAAAMMSKRLPERPVVGDWVAIRWVVEGKEAGVEHLVTRRTKLSRRAAGDAEREQVLAANVDRLLVVMAHDGDYNVRRLERYLLLARAAKIPAIVVLNKADLVKKAERDAHLAELAPYDVLAFSLSAETGRGVPALDREFRAGETVALLGSSGVGKSSLINRLLGREELITGEVRESDSRGRHTTTHRQIVRLACGALMVDNPGLREVASWGADGEGVADAFADVLDVATRCRFTNCRHATEPGCAVRTAVERGELDESRLKSYLKLAAESGAGHRRRKGQR